MRYSDIVKINNDFQYSVNLQYDLDNINKVKDYILTKDGCDLLKFYCNSIINKKNRATKKAPQKSDVVNPHSGFIRRLEDFQSLKLSRDPAPLARFEFVITFVPYSVVFICSGP